MQVKYLFLYIDTPLRRGADVLARDLDGLTGALGTAGRIPIITPENTSPYERVIPDTDNFELNISRYYADGETGATIEIPLNYPPAINYAVAIDDHGKQTGFFVSYNGNVKASDYYPASSYIPKGQPPNTDLYIFTFERDVINTAMQSYGMRAILGGNLLEGARDCQDVQTARARGLQVDFSRPFPVELEPAESGFKSSYSITGGYVVAGLFRESLTKSIFATKVQADDVTGLVWLFSDVITAGTSYDAGIVRTISKRFGFLSSAMAFRGEGENWKDDIQITNVKMYILPLEFAFGLINSVPDKEGHGGYGGARAEVKVGDAVDVDKTNFFSLRASGTYTRRTVTEIPQEYKDRDAGVVTFGTFHERIPLDGSRGENAVETITTITPNGFSLYVTIGGKTRNLSHFFECSIGTKDTQAITAQEAIGYAVRGVGSIGATVAGAYTGNALAVGGGILSGAGLLAELATGKSDGGVAVGGGNAFETIFSQWQRNDECRHGLYFGLRRYQNAKNVRELVSAYGEKTNASPIIDITHAFGLDGTGGKNCLYFKIAGGAIRGFINAEDGAAVLSQFQNGIRIWKNVDLMERMEYLTE